MEDMPARAGIYKDTVRKLSVPTVRALAARGITQLFSHQADAIDSATSGKALPSLHTPHALLLSQGVQAVIVYSLRLSKYPHVCYGPCCIDVWFLSEI